MPPVQGKLVGKTPGPDTKLDFDIYDVNNVDVLFEGLAGASLLEHILLWYQSKEMDIPWFIQGDADQAELRTLIRSPASRELQETTIQRYMGRIYSEGLSQVVSGKESWSCGYPDQSGMRAVTGFDPPTFDIWIPCGRYGRKMSTVHI